MKKNSKEKEKEKEIQTIGTPYNFQHEVHLGGDLMWDVSNISKVIELKEKLGKG